MKATQTQLFSPEFLNTLPNFYEKNDNMIYARLHDKHKHTWLIVGYDEDPTKFVSQDSTPGYNDYTYDFVTEKELLDAGAKLDTSFVPMHFEDLVRKEPRKYREFVKMFKEL